MDIRDPSVTREEVEKVAKRINACYLVETSAKIEDKEQSGVADLEDAIMTIGFYNFDGEDRPNWGDLNGEQPDTPEAPPNPRESLRSSVDQKARSDEPVKPANKPTKDKDGTEVKGPENVPAREETPTDKPGAKKDPDAGCECVIAYPPPPRGRRRSVCCSAGFRHRVRLLHAFANAFALSTVSLTGCLGELLVLPLEGWSGAEPGVQIGRLSVPCASPNAPSARSSITQVRVRRRSCE